MKLLQPQFRHQFGLLVAGASLLAIIGSVTAAGAGADDCVNQLDIDACKGLCTAAEGTCKGVCGAAETTCKGACTLAGGACSGVCGAGISICRGACEAAECTLDALSCAFVDCCAGTCTGSDDCKDCFGGCEDDCEDDCKGDCNGCKLGCESGCATKCTNCEIECDKGCDDLFPCQPFKQAGESCVPLLQPCDEGLICQPLPSNPDGDELVCIPADNDGFTDDDECREHYSSSVHEDAINSDTTFSFGYGSAVEAVAGLSLEAGVVYGNDGCYGCYFAECLSAASNVGVEAFIALGLWTSYSDFQGDSLGIVAEAGEGISFATANFTNLDFDFIGNVNALSLGVSILPFEIGVLNCITLVDTAGCLNESGELVDVTNNPPTAFCTDKTVCAGEMSCTAAVSIDSGSTDADGDAVSLGQNPASPYGIGTRSVELTVTDPMGLTDMCSGSVTVDDCHRPTISCPAPTVAECTNNKQAVIDPGDATASDCTLVSVTDPGSSSYPLGTTPVNYIAFDSVGQNSSCSTSVTVRDRLQPSISCPASMNIQSLPGQCSISRPFSVPSTDACDPAPTVACVDQEGTAIIPASATFAVGTTNVTCTSTDSSGNSRSCGFDVTVNDPPITTVSTVSQVVQYSDKIAAVEIKGTDCGNQVLSLSHTAIPSGLAIGTGVCDLSGSGTMCTWELAGAITENAGPYSVDVRTSDGLLYSALVKTAQTVTQEDASVEFDIANVVAHEVESPGGDSGPFSLVFHIRELVPDLAGPGAAMPGDIDLAAVSVVISPVGPGSGATGSCSRDATDVTGSAYSDVLHIKCDFDGVGVNVYTVGVTINGAGYYVGSAEDVLTVFDPSLGFTTGGMWFYWPGTTDRTNVGYTMKYNKGRKKRPQGSFLMVRHHSDGTQSRVKSNAVNGLAIGQVNGADPFGWASFNGKAGYLAPGDLAPAGNHEFVAYAEDYGSPGTGSDRVWVQILDPNNQVVTDLSMSVAATANAVPIDGGNIIVPHMAGTP